MQVSGTFLLKGHTGFQIDHEFDEDTLVIWFFGGLIVRHGDRFDRYLAHLEALEQAARHPGITHIHCHLEHLGEVLSRAQHAVYRMLRAMRDQGRRITIYATGELPEQSDHLKMARLFVTGVSKYPGPPVKLEEIRRAS